MENGTSCLSVAYLEQGHFSIQLYKRNHNTSDHTYTPDLQIEC